MKNSQKQAFAASSINDRGEGSEQEGLSKREYFAGLAMSAWAQHAKAETYDSIAKGSVKMADALLAELEKSQP